MHSLLYLKMETFDIEFNGHEYTVIPGEDGSFLILLEGVEAARVKMKNNETCDWEVIEGSLTDEEKDMLCDKIESHYT